MNLKDIFPVIAIAAVAATVGIVLHHRTGATLRRAQQSERSGDLEQALSLYTATVFERAPAIDLPDINRSRFATPEVLRREVERYITWISSPPEKKSSMVTTAQSGIARCESRGRHDNTITEPVITPLSPDQYLEEWNRTFFAPKVTPHTSHQALAAGNHARRLSQIVIRSTKSYTYEFIFINPATQRGIKGILYPESSVRLHAVPGNHLLLCRSMVSFPSGELWQSHFTPIPLTVPSETSLITTELRTSIQRSR